MISREQLYNKLLSSNMFDQNKYLDKYVELMFKLYINPETGKGKYISTDEIDHYEELGWIKK